jgi:hypothetical protein
LPVNITYLLGAGASAEVLPCIKDIPNRLNDFIGFISNHLTVSSELDGRTGKTKEELRQEFILELKDLLRKVQKHESIDTYAKKLYLTRSTKYGIVKAITSCYFIYEQLQRDADYRYDSFLASVLHDELLLPSHIKILSWNYDFQFEKAFSQYTGHNNIEENQKYLRVVSNKFDNDVDDNTFALIKINGTTEYRDKVNPYNPSPIFKDLNSFENAKNDIASRLFWLYKESVYSPAIENCLSFAWEKSFNSKTLSTAFRLIRKTDILIVIGYSFPFFNREIDRKLFEAMVDLKTIYVQDKYSPEGIIEKLPSVFPTAREMPKPIPIHQVKNFHLPAEI